jgi:lipopolysaccharide export LptBFGC system permease protein LptF
VNKTKKCKYCFSEIDKNATICRVCGSDQSKIWFMVIRLGIIVTIVSIIPALFSISSFFQYRETKLQRIKAEEANNSALKAQKQAEKALEAAQKSEQAVINTRGQMREVVFSLLSLIDENEFEEDMRFTNARFGIYDKNKFIKNSKTDNRLKVLASLFFDESSKREKWVADVMKKSPIINKNLKD